MISIPFNGVVIPGGVLGVLWDHHVNAHAAQARAAAAPASMRKRRAATATPASVNRGIR